MIRLVLLVIVGFALAVATYSHSANGPDHPPLAAGAASWHPGHTIVASATNWPDNASDQAVRARIEAMLR